MENILFIILIALIFVLCCFVAVGNLLRRRRGRKRSIPSLKNLELLRQQGMITEEELESLKNGAGQLRELPVESCTLSAEEMMEAIEAALDPVNSLEIDKDYKGDDGWAEALGIYAALNLSLRELTLISMKMAKPRNALDLMTEVLAMNVPIDALEAAQSNGRTTLPNYKAAARMIWVQARERISEPISIRKEIHQQQESADQPMPPGQLRKLLVELVSLIMRVLNIPTTSSGFAVILALIVAKTEFGAFSHEDQNSS